MGPLPASGVPGRLKDPLEDRSVPPELLALPAAELLDMQAFWGDNFGTVTREKLDILEEHLIAEGLLTKELLLSIIKAAQEEFSKEMNCIQLKDPVTIVGDIHGQYYDLKQLKDLGGNVDDTQYLFLGDYVDRGSFSTEVVTYLYAVKIYRPGSIRLLRGNHESRQMTAFFNFREECEYKYDATIYDAIMDSFDCLPVAALVNGQFLTVHGGLSPELKKVDDINHENRFQEPPEEGLLCDILWSDPQDTPSRDGQAFTANEVRGCAWYYSFSHTCQFLRDNRLMTLIRAHEVQVEGYKMHKKIPKTNFPSVITVFSAPNYCDAYGNKAAVLMLENNTLNVKQFHFTEHPYHLPNFMGVFEWSMPFMAEKITEMLQAILVPNDEDDVEGMDTPEAIGQMTSWTRKSMSTDSNHKIELVQKLTAFATNKYGGVPVVEEAKHERAARLKRKIQIASRMARIFRTLRQENDLVMELKGVCPDHRLSPGLLLAGREGLKNELDLFLHTEKLDKENEKRPSEHDLKMRRSGTNSTMTSRPGMQTMLSKLSAQTIQEG